VEDVMMLEKDMENLIAKHPDEFFPNSGFNLVCQQKNLSQRRVDIVFNDKYDRTIIIEIKRGVLSREAAGQVMEYYGLLKKEKPEMTIELILCANTIPHERREFLERHGIECKEIGVPQFEEVAKKVGYEFIEANKIQGPESVDQKNIVSSQGVVMNNHEMFAEAVKKHRGEILSTPEIREIVLKMFPQFSKGSLLPNDHGQGNKSPCKCAGTEKRIFDRIARKTYYVR
jgi:hypothetical protein